MLLWVYAITSNVLRECLIVTTFSNKDVFLIESEDFPLIANQDERKYLLLRERTSELQNSILSKAMN